MCGSVSAWNTCDDVIDVATWIARWSGRTIAPKRHVRLLLSYYATEPERFIYPGSVSAVARPDFESSPPSARAASHLRRNGSAGTISPFGDSESSERNAPLPSVIAKRGSFSTGLATGMSAQAAERPVCGRQRSVVRMQLNHPPYQSQRSGLFGLSVRSWDDPVS